MRPPPSLALAGAPGVRPRRRHAVRLSLRPPPPHLLDRVPPRRRGRPRAPRRLLLRSAGLGSAAGELRRHRQGRRAAASLVSPRAPGDERPRPRDADVLGRDDVRVPDAAAADARLPGHAAGSELPRERPAPDRIRRRARHALGHLGVGLCVHRSRRQLSIQGVRRAGPRPEARARGRPRRRAVCDGAGEPGRSRGRGGELQSARPAAGWTGGSASTKSIDYRPRQEADVTTPSTANPQPAIVRAFFAHHQGMSLVALANVVCDDVFVKRFHADPRVQATELLLQERVPREAILSEPRPSEGAAAAAPVPAAAAQAIPIAAHGQPAHALPVERPLHRGADARRRRLQHVARPGGHPRGARIGRRMPARTSSTCAIRGRATSGRPPTSQSAASRTNTRRPSSSTR